MNARVSVPKLLRRKDRWYVRVQVPKPMQEQLGKKEYWISLKTSDRQDALRVAPDIVRNKRAEINLEYNRRMEIRQTLTEFTNEQYESLFRDEYSLHVTPGLDLIPMFESSPFDNFADFICYREEQLEASIARLRASRGRSGMIDLAMRMLTYRNGIDVEVGSKAEADLRKICVDSYIEGKRNIAASLRGRSIHTDPNPVLVDLETGLDLSRFRAAPSARLSHLSFEGDRAFPAQC